MKINLLLFEKIELKYTGGFMKHLLMNLILLISLTLGNLNAQRIQITNIDPSNYPEIMMEFFVKDALDSNIRSFNAGDLIIKENCPSTQVKYYNCPPMGQSKFSLILTFDYSGSMFDIMPNGQQKYVSVVNAAKTAVKSLPDPTRWECAITAFSSDTKIVTNFTNNIDTLLKYIDLVYSRRGGQTDYNAGFLYDVYNSPGALKVAEKAKYKPVVLFMTDGEHSFQSTSKPSRFAVWETQIIQTAAGLKNIYTNQANPATIYAMTFGFPMPVSLSNICHSTPFGEAYASTLDETDLQNLLQSILSKAGTLGPPAPCQLVWNSCCTGGELNFSVPSLKLSFDTAYTIPDNVKPYIEVDNTTPMFKNTPSGQLAKVPVKITARRNFVVFKGPGFTSSDGKFSIDFNGQVPSFPFNLKKDSSINVFVTYTGANDFLHYSSDIVLQSSACDGNLIKPFAGWIYTNPVDVGSTTLGNTKTTDITLVLCNTLGVTVKVTDQYFDTGNKSDFGIVKPQPQYDLPTDSCQTFTFSFKPGDNGDRTSILYFKTSQGDLSTTIKGSGSGSPEIEAIRTVLFNNTDCITSQRDTNISIKNTGALDLDISSFSLSNTTDFQFIPANPSTQKILPNAKYDVTIRFIPASPGPKTCVLDITSNAKTEPDIKINLSGTGDEISFKTSVASVNYQELCIGETKDLKVNLSNTGTTPITINASDVGQFTLPVQSWTIPVGGNVDATISFTGNVAQTFNATINFKDTKCNTILPVTCTAIVASPKIASVPLNLKTTVSNFIEGKITIQNTSNRDLVINKAQPRDPQITVVSPALNWTIAKNSSFDITVRYAPTNDIVLNTFIDLEGTPCGFKDSLNVVGNPDQAIASLQVDAHTGYIGFPIDIPLHIRNTNKLVESKAVSISAFFTYDQTLLQYKSVSPACNVVVKPGYLDISNMLVNNISGDVLVTLTFDVIPSSKIATDIVVSDGKSVGGDIKFTYKNGIFSVIPVSATIEIGTVTAKPGETFELPIYLKDLKNISDINQNILTTISYNGYLFEPIGSTPKGTIDANGIRTIDLTLPLKPDGSGVLQKLQFRAMLGNAAQTDINLSGTTKVAKGSATITEKKGYFTTDGICKSGGDRLYDPKGLAQIVSINPNPVGNKVSITIEAQEQGIHRLELVSYSGNKVKDIFSGELKPGIYTFESDLSVIASGIYYLSYTTPTKSLTNPVNILK